MRTPEAISAIFFPGSAFPSESEVIRAIPFRRSEDSSHLPRIRGLAVRVRARLGCCIPPPSSRSPTAAATRIGLRSFSDCSGRRNPVVRGGSALAGPLPEPMGRRSGLSCVQTRLDSFSNLDLEGFPDWLGIADDLRSPPGEEFPRCRSVRCRPPRRLAPFSVVGGAHFRQIPR